MSTFRSIPGLARCSMFLLAENTPTFARNLTASWLFDVAANRDHTNNSARVCMSLYVRVCVRMCVRAVVRMYVLVQTVGKTMALIYLLQNSYWYSHAPHKTRTHTHTHTQRERERERERGLCTKFWRARLM